MRLRYRVLTAKLKQLRNGLQKFFSDLREFWPGQLKIVQSEIDKIFKEEGPGWQKLAKSTIKWRRRHGYRASPILSASGKLRASLNSTGPGSIVKNEKTALTIGTNLPQAAPQQYGAEIVKYSRRNRAGANVIVKRSDKGRKDKGVHGKIPARPFLKQTESMAKSTSDYAREYLAKVIATIVSQPPSKPKDEPNND